jgi:hypothetical protein
MIFRREMVPENIMEEFMNIQKIRSYDWNMWTCVDHGFNYHDEKSNRLLAKAIYSAVVHGDGSSRPSFEQMISCKMIPLLNYCGFYFAEGNTPSKGEAIFYFDQMIKGVVDVETVIIKWGGQDSDSGCKYKVTVTNPRIWTLKKIPPKLLRAMCFTVDGFRMSGRKFLENFGL